LPALTQAKPEII